MAKHQLTDDHVVALMVRVEAGRIESGNGYEFDSDARQAALELVVWMTPFAHHLLCRLAPTVRGTLERAEVESYTWMFIQSVSVKGYLTYRSERSASGTRHLTPRQYLFNRRSDLKNFFRQTALQGGFGEVAKRNWQDVQTTQRQLNRFLHKGQLLEYQLTAIDRDVESWAAMVPWRATNTSRPYRDRRFLPRSTSDGFLNVHIGPSEVEVETRLDQLRPVRGGHLVRPTTRSQQMRWGTGWTLTDFGPTGPVRRPVTLAAWLEELFSQIQPPIPLRGTTILALRRAHIESITVDSDFSETYGG